MRAFSRSLSKCFGNFHIYLAKGEEMNIPTRASNFLIGVTASLFLAGTSAGADLNLQPSNVGFQNPIGIDFQETTGKLILSDFYSTGSPHNLDLADPVTGTKTQFS